MASEVKVHWKLKSLPFLLFYSDYLENTHNFKSLFQVPSMGSTPNRKVMRILLVTTRDNYNLATGSQ